MQKIVFVSPSDASQKLIADVLEVNGYGVSCFSSWEGIEQAGLAVSKQALFVLDHSLGDKRIIDSVNGIREEQGEFRIPIMVISATARAMDVLRLYKQGIDDYYLKPLDAEVFCSRVLRLLTLFPTPGEKRYPDSIELDLNRLINFEIARAKRGNYPFAIIHLSLDITTLRGKPAFYCQRLFNNCYKVLQGHFRETDIMIGSRDGLVILCPFSDRQGTQVVMDKIIKQLNDHKAKHPFTVLDMSYAIYPYDGQDQGGLWTFAAANKESLEL